MADQATRRNLPPKDKKPSRLRHEIHLESTDDERGSLLDIVQRSYDSVILLEAQPNDSRNADKHKQDKCDPAEAPLSPNSRITLERFGANKRISISKSDPVLFKPFTKEPAEPVGGSLLSRAFSYGRVTRKSNHTKAEKGSVEFRPTAGAILPLPANEERSEQKADDSTARNKPAPGYRVQEPNIKEDIHGEHKTEAYDETQEIPQGSAADSLGALAPPSISVPSLLPAPVVSREGLVANSEDRALQEDHKEINKCRHEKINSKDQLSSSPPDSRNDPLLCPSGLGDDTHGDHPPLLKHKNQQPHNAQSIVLNDLLHRTSSRVVPDRIVKPQQKLRKDTKPATHGPHRAFISPTVEKLLRELQLTVLADSFRKDHEHSTELKHVSEKAILLQQQLDLKDEIIVGCRNHLEELKTALHRVANRATTNQKFLEGFQKDYEKLKRLTTAAQEDNRTVLQAKIAELEEEKKTLRCEFEITACKLAESQRKMRAVADELFVQLAIAHSTNESLAKRLKDLEAVYENERKNREDVQKEVLNRVQNLQLALVSNVEQLQASIEKADTQNHQKTKIKDCLDVIKDLQTAPLLKVQDIRRAEGMLCSVQACVESGLEDLHKAIAHNLSSNADLHESIMEQLQDLRSSMKKYEEVAADNCKINESSVALRQQLEAMAKAQMDERQNFAAICEKLSEKFRLQLSEMDQEFQREITQLKVDLRGKEAVCERLSENLITANAHLDELKKETEDQKNVCKELQAQVSQQQSTMKETQEKADENASQMQQEAQEILQSTQNKAALLEKEKESLLIELSQARANENTMKEANGSCSAENDRLNQEIQKMHSMIEEKNTEITQIRHECTDEHRKVIEQCRDDMEDYKRRLAEKDALLKELEANARLLEAQHQSGQEFPTANGRKKVNRDNQSVIEAAQEHSPSLQFPMLFRSEESRAQSDDQDLFATLFDLDSSLQNGVKGDLIVNHECDSVPGIQYMGVSPLSRGFSLERPVQARKKSPSHQTLNSSEFSSVASDELAQIQKEAESASICKLQGQTEIPNRPEASLDKEKIGESHADNVSVASSRSLQSQERPRSQANTSSRMISSYESASKPIQSPPASRVLRIKLPGQHEKFGGILQKTSGCVSLGKRKTAASETDSDLTSKKQRGISSANLEFSISGTRRQSPRSSRQSIGGQGLSESDALHAKGNPLTHPHSRSQGRSSKIQLRSSNHISSEKARVSRQQPSQLHTSLPKRQSSRVTRNQSRNGTAFGDDFSERFNEELQGMH